MRSLLLISFLCVSCVGNVIVDEEHPVQNQCEVQQVQEVVCNIPCETNHCYQNCQEDFETGALDWSWTMCFTQWSPND